jgi:hypothetical protein
MVLLLGTMYCSPGRDKHPSIDSISGKLEFRIAGLKQNLCCAGENNEAVSPV